MSRIGKKPVPVGAAKVTISDRTVKVEGKQGTLSRTLHPLITVALDSAKKELVVTRADDSRVSRAQHGTARALLANMIEGVTTGYKKTLEIQGVGYKAEAQGWLCQPDHLVGTNGRGHEAGRREQDSPERSGQAGRWPVCK
jgi:large subunit ribosomal protein L6